ncbi:unnamed protein product [Discula destructiva]
MSNVLVGNIYRSIMDEVIESSRVDFEEGGVEEGVLEDLRKGWQIKLSELKIATFPWDPPPPAPAPAAAAAAPPTTQGPSAIQQTSNYTSAVLSPQSNAQQDWSKNMANGLPQNNSGQQFNPEPIKQDPTIKQEPGLSNNASSAAAPANAPHYGGGPSGNVAAQRAMNQLQNQYGARAAASISAIQGYGGGGQTGQAQRPLPTGPQGPGQAPPSQGANAQAQYAQQLRQQQQMMAQQRGAAAAAAAQQHPGQQRTSPAQPNPSQQNNSAQNGFQQSQVDGATDEAEFEGVLMRQNDKGETSEMGRMDIDRMLHQQMASKAKAMEGGGLMLPLKEATKSKSLARKSGSSGPSGFDGGADSDSKREEEDDETINSDLDDPNDPQDEDDDDEIDQIMLCMYDKVQRVKNKWKCTLKDGVMNVNGKDYVFHKATGEYEW